MKKEGKIILGVAIVLVVIVLFFYFGKSSSKISLGPLGSTHEHAIFLTFIKGQFIDFSKPEYMVQIKEVHIENLDGTVIHKHTTGVTIGYFLNSLGVGFDKDCLVLGKKEKYCNDGQNTLKFYVNGNQNNEFGNYVFRNNDKMLITYGDPDNSNTEGQLISLDEIKIN